MIGPAIAVGLAAAGQHAPAYPQRYLASVVGVEIGRGEYVSAFSIDTWRVDVLAVCRMPPGWTMTAGRSADPSGVIAGQGAQGVTNLDRAHLHELDDLVLVQLHGPVQPRTAEVDDGEAPATFTGHAKVGRYGADGGERKIRLTYANIRLRPSEECPRPNLAAVPPL